MKNRLCWFGKLNRTLKKQKGPCVLRLCFTVGLRGCDSEELQETKKDNMLEVCEQSENWNHRQPEDGVAKLMW